MLRSYLCAVVPCMCCVTALG